MQLSVALPISLVSDVPHLREKTSRLGMVGRALAIFRVEEVILYQDQPDKSQDYDVKLISTVLRYMETPQYLRKYLFPKLSILKYVGILPPLRTPHHPLPKKIADLKDGDWREGVVINIGAKTLVDIGVERPIPLNETNLSRWQRITVTIHRDNHKLNIRRIKKSHTNKSYWGYKVNILNSSLGKILRSNTFDLFILTSRYGKPLTEANEKLRSRLPESNKILIAFGSPKHGIKEILEMEGIKIDITDSLVVNTIPEQGVETVRTEEALYATLAVINTIR